MRRILSLLVLGSIIAVSLLITGCGKTEIGTILDDFQKYEGDEVTISGTVGSTRWLSLVDRGAYEVGDGSGTIWIVTTEPPPQEGSKVTVKGTVQAAVSIGDESFGKSIEEIERK